MNYQVSIISSYAGVKKHFIFTLREFLLFCISKGQVISSIYS